VICCDDLALTDSIDQIAGTYALGPGTASALEVLIQQNVPVRLL